MATTSYDMAKDAYKAIGIDTDNILKRLATVPISIHCWQGDDVGGFERPSASLSGGGIQVTGNYPGKARSIAELRMDLEKVFSLVPGPHRLNLHASYGEFGKTFVDRDQIEEKHFAGWVEWAKKLGIGIDFNGTFFSHPMADSGYTLSSKDPKVRSFWIEHAKRCRKISAWIGQQLGTPCVLNTWVPDGAKDLTVDKITDAIDMRMADDRNLLGDLLPTPEFLSAASAWLQIEAQCQIPSVNSTNILITTIDKNSLDDFSIVVIGERATAVMDLRNRVPRGLDTAIYTARRSL